MRHTLIQHLNLTGNPSTSYLFSLRLLGALRTPLVLVRRDVFVELPFSTKPSDYCRQMCYKNVSNISILLGYSTRTRSHLSIEP